MSRKPQHFPNLAKSYYLSTFHLDKKAAMRQTVVLYPGGGVGHVVPMTELANAFLKHGYDVTMVLLEPPVKSSDSGASVVQRIAASNPSISFHVLSPLPAPDFAASGKHPFFLILQLMRQYNERLETFLRSIPRQRLHSLVIDMFCVDAIDVCAKLGVPVYTFVASGASTLSVLTQLPTLLAHRQTGLKELGDTPLDFLGVPPMPASHLIKQLLEHPEDELCKAMTDVCKRNTDTMGVLVNTFESLESRAVQALRDPLCVPGRVLPPIYCVGPLVGKGGKDGDKAERHDYTSASRGSTLNRRAASCSSASEARARSPRISSRRSLSAWRSPGNGSCGPCARRPVATTRRSTLSNAPSRTSRRSCRRGSWSGPRTGAS